MSPILTVALCSWVLAVSTLSPGPDVFLVFRTALSEGFKAGFRVSSGISLGFLLHTCVICFAGTWMMQQPWSFALVILGGLYLLYLAWKILPLKPLGAAPEDAFKQKLRRTKGLFLRGLICNLLNVKCVLFISALILPGLEKFGETISWYSLAICTILPLVGWLTWMLWCGLLQVEFIKRFYLAHLRLWDTVFALLLGFFACGIIWHGVSM